MNKKTQPKSTKNNKMLAIKLQQIAIPDYSEKIISGQKYVRWGVDNKFPDFLQSLMNRSAIHNAILTSKASDAFGKGLVISDEAKDVLTKAFCKHPNPYETIDDIYKKLIFDYVLYGSAALNVVWDADKTHIAELYHVDTAKIRCGKKNERGIIETYYFSNSWNKSYNVSCTEIPAFNPNKRIGSQLLYITDYRPGSEYYSLPSYSGALTAIATDIEISNFHLSHLKNGMSPSKMITFTDGRPSEEEEQTLVNQITDTYSGTDNAGKLLINFVDSQDKTPVVETLGGDNLGDEFIQLEQSVLNQILAGHRVTSPLLVGIRGENQGLGSNSNEILEAFKVFVNTVIRPIQDTIIKSLNNVIKYTRGYQDMLFEPTTNTPIDFTFTESILTQICTKNELREMINLEPLEEEQKKELENE